MSAAITPIQQAAHVLLLSSQVVAPVLAIAPAIDTVRALARARAELRLEAAEAEYYSMQESGWCGEPRAVEAEYFDARREVEEPCE